MTLKNGGRKYNEKIKCSEYQKETKTGKAEPTLCGKVRLIRVYPVAMFAWKDVNDYAEEA